MIKYALHEIERRRSVINESLPDLTQLECWSIQDRYLHGCRMRLRKMVNVRSGEAVYKLCKKYGHISMYEEPIVNIYLDFAEFEALSEVPGDELNKNRYYLDHKERRFGIDEFSGALQGLYLIEVEAGSVSELIDIEFPDFAGEDVTGDEQYSGAALARSKK